MRYAFAILLALALGGPALAVTPDEMLSDPTLEARARALSAELRCLVCQNQSIDDSNAPLAHDLRVLVRERLTAGDSDEEVMAFLVDRYGEFILLRPTFSGHNLLLWMAPFLGLALGAGALAIALRRRRRQAPAAPLSAEEQGRLRALLADDQGDRP